MSKKYYKAVKSVTKYSRKTKSCRQTKNELGYLVRYKESAVSENLKVDPFFLKVLSLDAGELFFFNLNLLKSFGYVDVKFLEHPECGYIFARGTLPVCLCAHMDKVPWYKHIVKINKNSVVDDTGKVIDVVLSSLEGIGGDDRCGVYAIFRMLKLGHRPSILFCMGEEIGCCGSHRFCDDYPKEFLSDIHAFIQIDRRGNHDCVRYSDDNESLTKAIEPFGFKHAWGSCTDISVLMPHFGISGVNLSSGYYNEHHATLEYVSVKDVNSLLARLDNILKSDIFSTLHAYKAHVYAYTGRGFSFHGDEQMAPETPSALSPAPSPRPAKKYEQLSLLDEYPYEDEDFFCYCDWCGEVDYAEDLIEVQDDFIGCVCPSCAESLVKSKEFLQCPCCKKLFRPQKKENDPSFLAETCPFCGCVIDNEL